MRAVEVDGVTHRYGERVALRDVRFAVDAGEVFGLLGPNGSGKTTLFGILATLFPQNGDGAARIFGLDVARDRDLVRSRIGVVFQSPSLDKKLTVAENLMHQGHIYGLRGAPLAARIDELLSRVGLADRKRDLVETLSGGSRRRVELAKGLLHRPPLLLLDEPTTGFDPNARREFLRSVEEMRRTEGTTVLMTTHYMEEAERMDRVAILDRGALVAIGVPSALKETVRGDVVTVEAKDPERLAAEVAARFGAAAAAEAKVVDGRVRIELPQAHRLVAELVEAFPGRIDSVTVGRPTLEDVFVHHTGHRFEVGATR